MTVPCHAHGTMTEELPHPGALVEGRYRIVDKIGEGGHGVV
jgi:hypothetical protein